MAVATALSNAEADCLSLEHVINDPSTAPDVVTRLDRQIPPLAKVIASAEITAVSMVAASAGYEPPVIFGTGLSITRPSQTVYFGGETYAAVPTAVPFTTTSTFNPAQWKLIVAKNILSRTELKNLANPSNGQMLLLVDAFKSGPFIFTSANVKSFCDADPQEGVYIKPTGQDGTTGAWVRQWEFAVNVRWFGAVGNNVTDDSSSIQAAITLVEKLSLPGASGTTIYRGGPPLYFPTAHYFCSTTIEPKTTIKIIGDGGIGWGAGTMIRYPANVTGLRAQAHNTSGATTIDGTPHFAGDQLVVQDIYFYAPGFNGSAVTENESHGCHAKRLISLIRCTFDGFQGDGLFIDGTGTGGIANEGHVENCWFAHNRNGRRALGGDSNAWKFVGNVYNVNRAWGVRDGSFLGNYESFAHAANNGIVANMSAFTMVSYSGNRYSVREGQEVGALTNAPSGTTANNTWWYFNYAGGVAAGTIPAWTSGMGGATLRSGGAYYMAGVNQTGMLLSCYSEAGQGPSQIISPCMVLHGTLGSGVRGSGSYMHQATGMTIIERGEEISGGLWVKGGDIKVTARTQGAFAGDQFLVINSTDHFVNFEGPSGGAPWYLQWNTSGALKAQMFASGNDFYIDNVNGRLHIRKLDGTKGIALAQQTRPGSPGLADVIAALDAVGFWA